MPKKMTQDEFLHRIRTSEFSTQEAFTNEALIRLYEYYFVGNPARCPKFFNVLSLLSKWQEFSNDDTAKAYCDRNTRNISPFILRFDTGLLVWISEF